MPLFSIVVPVYNVEKYLSDCLESILNQTFSDFELILVDDGSNDKSPSICDQYSMRFPFIRVIHKTNGGVVSARKTGLNASCGFYILSVDSDDIIPDDLLETLAKVISIHKPDIIAFDYQNILETGEFTSVVENLLPEGLYDSKNKFLIEDNFLYNSHLPNYYNTGSIIYSLWSKCIKRELLSRYQNSVPDSIRNGDDVAVLTPVIVESRSVYILRYVGYYYRTRCSSLVHTFNPDEIYNYLTLMSYINSLNLKLPESNISGYAFREIFLQYTKAAKAMRFNEFKDYVKKTYNSITKGFIEKYNSNNMNLKSRLVSYLVKKRLWFVFWRIYH